MRRGSWWWLVAATCVAATGCGGEDRDGAGGGDASVSASGLTAAADGGTDADDDDDDSNDDDDDDSNDDDDDDSNDDDDDDSNDDDDDDDDPIFDVGGDPPSGTTGETSDSCAKVDILYVIDNSPSMYEEQQTLIDNFGNFVADMQTALVDVDDYHIGVITTDDFGNGGFFDDGANSVNGADLQCQGLGGLVVQAHSGDCRPFADGNNFITHNDDLTSKFECIANVGEDGDSDEKVGDALITFLASQLIDNDVSDCNEGFLRDDALLVLVILTDEDDVSSTGPVDWHAAVVNAKGAPENAVVLSLIWDQSVAGCEEDLSEADGDSIASFTEMFPNHAVGSICQDSYAGFFTDTLPVIEGACDEFEPEG